MGTVTRPELSGKNRYWISKHRYYELKHFCLQYSEWKRALREADGFSDQSVETREWIDVGHVGDPSAECADQRIRLSTKIRLVDQTAYEACEHQFWYTFLVEAVTENVSYDVLAAKYEIMPISRNEWYDLYRRFFWILDQKRD